MMTEAALYDILRQALWSAVVMSAPLLATALVMGVVIGLLQALSSVQEMTLTFVPKVAAILVVFWMTMGFMTVTLRDLFVKQIIPLILGG